MIYFHAPMHLSIRKELPRLSTVVVKIGSRILTAPGHEKRVAGLVGDLGVLHASGLRVIVVSSGAIAHGMETLALKKRPSAIPLQQACAAVGQYRLMRRYEDFFAASGIRIGQVLLTWDDLRSKKRYFNLRNTLFQLLDLDAIPIVNENDSVGVEEIRFGNNDILGAQIALLAQADLFVNLTDVGGLYDRNPHTDTSARHIPVVASMSTFIRKMADDRMKEISVGGMATKLKAAEIVSRAGIYALIGDGFDQSLRDVLSKPRSATLFLPQRRRMSSRHRWIAFTGQSCGKLIIDEGARAAVVKRGKSLLPAGIRSVTGAFKAGDTVDIDTQNGKTIARGMANYSADEIRIIQSCKTSEIASRLGEKPFDEVIHRNNMVVLVSLPSPSAAPSAD
ncbi:MAG: glutamate 5-kinase [Chitinispirillaceae bacterium]|nr:glutamate 5-kinase [Chitinispirillaceae bacterium]